MVMKLGRAEPDFERNDMNVQFFLQCSCEIGCAVGDKGNLFHWLTSMFRFRPGGPQGTALQPKRPAFGRDRVLFLFRRKTGQMITGAYRRIFLVFRKRGFKKGLTFPALVFILKWWCKANILVSKGAHQDGPCGADGPTP